jgi:hypothetical protein
MDPLKQSTLKASCHCKAVQISFPLPKKPLNECLCSICRRYGALWAYFQIDEVQIDGQPTEFYVWGDKEIQFHRCKNCGCMTHWEPAEKTHKRVGINCRMLEREDLERLEVKKSEGPK